MALADLLADPTTPVNVAVELDSVHRTTGVAKTWYYSFILVATGVAAKPETLPYLTLGSIGPMEQSIASDVKFSGGSTISVGALTLVQPAADFDMLSDFHDYTFTGRAARVYIGELGTAYSSYYLWRTYSASREPRLEMTSDGHSAVFDLESALGRMLNENLISRRYRGLRHAYRCYGTGGGATAAHNAAYVTQLFTIMGWFRYPNGGTAGNNANICFKQTSVTTDNMFNGRVEQTTGVFRMRSTSGGAADIDVSTSFSVVDKYWHWYSFSRDGARTYNLVVDGELVASGIPTGIVNNATAAPIVWSSSSADDIDQLDTRLYARYIAPEEARALAYGDDQQVGLVGWWEFSDNAGTSVADTSVTNNDATIAGTAGVHHDWVASHIGGESYAGKPMPIMVGTVKAIPGQLIDTSRDIYRFNDGPLDDYTPTPSYVVRSQGTLLAGAGTDYTAPADTADTIIDMVSTEAEPVTADIATTVLPTAYIAQVAQSLLTNGRTRLTTANLANTTALTALAPWVGGYYTDTEVSAAQALREILGEAGCCYYENNEGNLYLDMLLPPTGYGPYGEPVLDFRGVSPGVIRYDGFSTTIAPVSGSFTLCGWFKTPLSMSPDGTAVGFDLLYKATPANNFGVSFEVTTSPPYNRVLTFRTDWGATMTSAPNPVEPNTWYFWAYVFDTTANTVKMFLAKQGEDLTLIQTLTGATGTPTSPDFDDVYFGDSTGVYQPWGSVQHVMVFNAALVIGLLGSIMEDGIPDLATAVSIGCVAWWPFNEGVGEPLELVSNTYPAEFTGVVWAPRFTLNLDEIGDWLWADSEGLRHVEPAAEIIVRWGKRYRPLQVTEIDVGVDSVTALVLRRQFKDVPYENPDLRDRFLHGLRLEFNTLLNNNKSVNQLITLLASRFSPDRYTGSLNLESGTAYGRHAVSLQVMDEIGIIGSYPSSLATGRSFRVVGVSQNPMSLAAKINLWG